MTEHLSVERISILLDEPWADKDAQTHLESCDACRVEFERMSRMRMAMSALGELEPPAGMWGDIEAALDEAGVGTTVRPLGRIARLLMISGPLQAAAAFALFAGGVVAGLQFTGNGPLTSETGAQPPAVLSATGDDRMLIDGLNQLESLGAPLRTVGLGAGDRPLDEPGVAAAERLLRLEALIKAMRDRLEADPSDPVASAYLFEYVEERARLAEEMERSFRSRRTSTW